MYPALSKKTKVGYMTKCRFRSRCGCHVPRFFSNSLIPSPLLGFVTYPALEAFCHITRFFLKSRVHDNVMYPRFDGYFIFTSVSQDIENNVTSKHLLMMFQRSSRRF